MSMENDTTGAQATAETGTLNQYASNDRKEDSAAEVIEKPKNLLIQTLKE